MSGALVHEVGFGTIEIPGFTFLRQIGEGRSGVVLKVRQGEATLALRVLDPKVFPNEQARARVIENLKSVQVLDHPNLITPLEVGFSDPHVWILEELVEGVSLEKMLQVDEALPLADALAVTQGILEGLACLEASEFVHGNVTLSNVLIDLYGVTRLTSVGLVPLPTDYEEPPAGASPLSDARYLAPERVLGLGLDGRSDLYSVGICLYRLLTATWPFPDLEGAKLSACHVNNDVPDPNAVNRVPPETAAFLRWLTDRDPLLRYPSAQLALADVVQLSAGQSPRGPKGTGPGPVTGDTTSGPAFGFGGPDDDEGIQATSCPYRVRLSSRGMTLTELNLDLDRASIGRSPQSAIHIDNPIVSRRHAEIRRQGHTFQIAALSATNETVVNGERVHDSVDLKLGDLVVLSDKFHLEIDWDPRIRVVSQRDEDPTPPSAQPRPVRPEARSAPSTRPAGRPTMPISRIRVAEPDLPSAQSVDEPSGSAPLARVEEPTEPRVSRRSEHGAEDGSRSGVWRAPRGYLAFARGGTEVRSFVSHGFQIGSSPSCEIRLARDLPRKAALIVRSSDGYRLYNTSPQHDAVTLNDEPLADQAVLEPGDRIEVFGNMIFFDIDH
jgi:serine/threonine protein kinase